MSSLTFFPISSVDTLSRFHAFQCHLSSCLEITSDYSFVNLWGWAAEYDLSWAWTRDLVWIKQQRPSSAYWAPLGAWADVDWAAVFEELFPKPADFLRVPEKLARLWTTELGNHIVMKESRGQWDYLYSVKELVALKGNRFHKKKNLVNQFVKHYDYQYLPMGKSLISAALSMQTDWCLWKDCESSETLAAENRVIEKILTHCSSFGNLMGGGIMCDEKLVAYTVAEPLTDDMLVIHFEKGDPGYKGVYQAIHQMFLESVAGTFNTVNREQDLDDPGLRKAKLSYHPTGFQKKYHVTYSP